MEVDNESIRLFGRIVANLERSRIYKVVKGPKLSNVLDMVEDIDLGYLGVNQKLCHNNRYTRKICNTCEIFCPVGAIEFNREKGIIIDEKKCIQCGVCGPVCPNGVFEVKIMSDEKMFSDIYNILNNSKTKNLRFDCTKCNGKYGKIKKRRNKKETLLIPCLGSISELFILWAHVLGVNKISYGRCDDQCQCTKGIKVFKRTRILIEHIMRSMIIVPTSGNSGESLVGEFSGQVEDEGTRRNFLADLGKKTAKIFDIGNEENSEEKEFWHQQVPKKRLALLKFAHTLECKRYKTKRRSLPFAEVMIDEDNCDLCEVCTALCPTGALSSLELDDLSIIYFNFGKCTGCGLCRRACPNKALAYREKVDLGMLKNKASILVKIRTESCSECGLKYVVRESINSCPQCEKRRSIQKGLNDSFNNGQ